MAWDSPGATWDGEAQPTSTTMAIDNKISLTVSPEQKSAIEAAITALRTALEEPVNLLSNLTAEEKQAIPKISDKTLAFHNKCQLYMTQNPTLVPNFVDMAERAKDLALVETLLPCLTQLRTLWEGMDDTVTTAFSDAYYGDLSFYQGIRVAAKRSVPGADTMYNDLKERFPGGRRASNPTPPADPPADPPTP